MGRLAASVLVVAGALAGWITIDVVSAPPASAHASLATTTPSEGARLDSMPGEVTLEFTEAVELEAGYARVLDPSGERVDAGVPTEQDGVVSIPLRDDLPEASYVVTYRVVSQDAHPIAGAYAFVVGDGELADAGAVAGGQGTDPGVAVALPLARWLGFAGVALGLGVPVFLLVCWPAGWTSPLMRRLTLGGLGAVGVGAVLHFLVQGAYAGGAGLGSLFDPSLLAATARSGHGITLALRLLLAVALAMLLRARWSSFEDRRRPLTAAAGVLALGIVVSTAAVGHPVAGPWPGLAVLVAAVHVAAMAVWLGGLTSLLVGPLRIGEATEPLVQALPRYSRMAFGAVVALVVTGVLQSVREVGTPTALLSTTYGWLLVAKLGVVFVVLGAAGISRVWVQQHFGVVVGRGGRRVTAHAFAATAEPPMTQLVDPRWDVGALRRSVLVEAVLITVVLAISAVLVGTPPARAMVAQPVDVTVPLEGDARTDAPGSVQLTVLPGGVGLNTLHVFVYDDSGRPAQPQDVRVTLTENEQQIGPLEVEVEPNGPGDYIGDDMSVPSAGTWTLTVNVRLDTFTSTTASTEISVR